MRESVREGFERVLHGGIIAYFGEVCKGISEKTFAISPYLMRTYARAGGGPAIMAGSSCPTFECGREWASEDPAQGHEWWPPHDRGH